MDEPAGHHRDIGGSDHGGRGRVEGVDGHIPGADDVQRIEQRFHPRDQTENAGGTEAQVYHSGEGTNDPELVLRFV
jgi:hypothetical protein